MEEHGERELLMLSVEAGRLLSKECKGHKPKIQQGGIEKEGIPDFALH